MLGIFTSRGSHVFCSADDVNMMGASGGHSTFHFPFSLPRSFLFFHHTLSIPSTTAEVLIHLHTSRFQYYKTIHTTSFDIPQLPHYSSPKSCRQTKQPSSIINHVQTNHIHQPERSPPEQQHPPSSANPRRRRNRNREPEDATALPLHPRASHVSRPARRDGVRRPKRAGPAALRVLQDRHRPGSLAARCGLRPLQDLAGEPDRGDAGGDQPERQSE